MKGISADEIGVAPTHRANFGGSFDPGRWFVNANVNYQDEAIWRDVLDARYWGPTDAFTSLNASVGARMNNNRVTLSLIGTNLLDEEIQQHVFGDIISRKIIAQAHLRF